MLARERDRTRGALQEAKAAVFNLGKNGLGACRRSSQLRHI
jgi:hypothetical protein